MTYPGVISAVELYTLTECKKRLHIGRHSFRKLRVAGLRILKIGRCYYVDGAELVGLIKKVGQQTTAGNGEDGE